MKLIGTFFTASLLAVPLAANAGLTNASTEDIGLYPASSFQFTDGKCTDCKISRPAQWYFEKETFAIPKKDGLPPLVWTGSSWVVNAARIAPDGKSVLIDNHATPLSLVPKLTTNLSYYNADTTAFFAKREVRLRGEVVQAADGSRSIVARTIWPTDFTVKPSVVQPLSAGETLRALVKAEDGGAKSQYATRTLWQRDQTQDWKGKTVMGLMLNGAQGDDDEAHGGHFGAVTGTYTDGSMHNWVVNNFYGINGISEKGIIAGVTPMDKYLADLNNGQSYYRPSYMLVAIMKSDKIARAYQEDMNSTFDRFYKHDFEYDHSKNNCSGISLDGFHRLGWNIPQLGNPDKIKAIPAYGYLAASKMSLQEGRKIYDYLTAESTRLFPAVAFDAMGEDMLALAQGKAGRTLTDFEKELSSEIEAIVFVRIPQIPSSRAFGLSPVASFSEYMKQAPEDRATWKIVPGLPRPFPDSLREHPAKVETEFPVPFPVALAIVGLLGIIAAIGKFVIGRLRRRKKS
jgi:hypothetical protein